MRKFITQLFRVPRGMTLTGWIFVGLIVGFLIGAFAPAIVPYVEPFRGLFLNAIKCIIAPLIFSTIVSGMAGAGSFGQLGLMGVRALVYFEAVTTAALAIGLLVVNWLKPGVGLAVKSSLTPALAHSFAGKISFGTFVEHLLPTNFADAVVRGDTLQIVLFSSLFGLSALSLGERAKPVVALCESLAEIMFRFTGYIMYLAPLGVGAALAASVSEQGWHVLLPLLKLVGSLYFALGLFVLVVLVPICYWLKIPVGIFFRSVKDAVVLAFATTSSESAYPLAFQSLDKLGVPRRITSFVLPLGYSFNLDGSTLYLAVASVFIAQTAGIPLSWGQQLMMMVTLLLTSKGVAAVPRASFVVLSGSLTAFGLPLEGLALILAVDTFMDMARTSINLLGNCLATVVVARWEGVELRMGETFPIEPPLADNPSPVPAT